MCAKNVPKGTYPTGKSRMPKDSVLFDKVIPASLIFMGILTVVLILFAAGVLLGIVQF
ncbi:MAG: hypothetical protein ACK2U1_21795 [Anaerolineales bacterium]